MGIFFEFNLQKCSGRCQSDYFYKVYAIHRQSQYQEKEKIIGQNESVIPTFIPLFSVLFGWPLYQEKSPTEMILVLWE